LINNLVASSLEETELNPSTTTKPVARLLSKGRIPKFDLLTP